MGHLTDDQLLSIYMLNSLCTTTPECRLPLKTCLPTLT